jgi:hypothetical protein
MPANIPGIATEVPQSKLDIGLFLITVYTLMLNNTDRPSAILWVGAMARGGLVSLIMHEEQRL